MFQLLGVAHYELKHSKIIAYFLDPNGLHGQGDMFLKLFLQVIGYNSNDNSNINTDKAEVFTEYNINDNGRIDIFIKDNSGNGIIIENKIYAGDQKEQLIRYHNYAKKHVIYYLTLWGNEASEKSAKGVEYICISYAEHIIKWLQSCIQHSATMPAIRESLVQYLNHVKKLTNQDMDSISEQELIELLGSEKNFETIISLDNFLVNNLNEIKKHSDAQRSIVQSWEEEIKKHSNITILSPEEYDDRAIFVVKIGEFHAYIGWSRDNYPKSVLFCQVEYDSEFRCKKFGKQRPTRDEKFDNLITRDMLKDNNECCRYQHFGKEYEDYARVFDCLKKVIERIIKAMPKKQCLY